MFDIIPNNLWVQDIFFKRKTKCRPYLFIQYTSFVMCSSVLCSLVVHNEGERFPFPIMQFQSAHMVVATLGLVRGSICLILRTEKKTIITQIYQFRSSVNVYPFYFRNITSGSAFGCIYIMGHVLSYGNRTKRSSPHLLPTNTGHAACRVL